MSSSYYAQQARTSDEAKAAQTRQITADLRKARDEWLATAKDYVDNPRLDIYREYAQVIAEGTSARIELIARWLDHEAERLDGYAADLEAHADGSYEPLRPA